MLHLVAVQAHLQADDFTSTKTFERKLDALGVLVREARTRTGVSAEHCLVVLPEGIGTWLILANEDPGGSVSFHEALSHIALRHPLAVARAALRWQTTTPTRAVLLALGQDLRQRYLRAFKLFARTHRAYVVAGSALLPDIDPGANESGRPRHGRLCNTSYLFDPEGHVLVGTRKVNLVPEGEDDLGLHRGSPRSLPVARTGIGRIATLIGYDAFSEPHTDDESEWRPVAPWVARAGAQILAQPSANPWPWNGAWIHNAPGESRLRRDQWEVEGLAGQLGALAGVRYAVTAHCVGKILGARFEGRSEILERDEDGTVRKLASARAAEALASSEEVLCAAVPDL